MKYWMAFFEQTKDLVCSVDGASKYIEGDEDSCKLCREKNRTFEEMYSPVTTKSEEAFNQRKAYCAHVKYSGKTYIIPIYAFDNTSLKDEEKEITLKAVTILV